jgi:hypothetical protein
MPLCCAEGHGMTWKAPHGVQWLTCDRQHCMSGLCDPCKPTYTCSDCDYDMCNVCAEVECAMPSRRTPPVEPVPLTPAADRPPRTPRTKEVPDLMPDPDSDGDDEEMEEEEGEEEEGEEAEAVEKRPRWTKAKQRRNVTCGKENATPASQAERQMLSVREIMLILESRPDIAPEIIKWYLSQSGCGIKSGKEYHFSGTQLSGGAEWIE